jgi:transposase InsO family protein
VPAEAPSYPRSGAPLAAQPLRACSARRPAAPRYQASGARPAAVAAGHRRAPRSRQGRGRRVPACDHRRPQVLAFAAMCPAQTKPSFTHLLAEVIAYFHNLGVSIQRVLTDSGVCYKAPSLQAALSQTGPETSPHPPYHPAHRRQGRTLHQTLSIVLDVHPPLGPSTKDVPSPELLQRIRAVWVHSGLIALHHVIDSVS